VLPGGKSNRNNAGTHGYHFQPERAAPQLELGSAVPEAAEVNKPKREKASAGRYGPCLALLLIVVLFAVVRLRLRNMPLERDEGEYAYAGQLLLQGIPPYALAYNMKLPGTYAAYALLMAVFGQTPAGVHLGLLLVNAATTLLIYLLAVRLMGQLGGVIAAAAYALLSTSPSVMGLEGHATHFVVLAAVAGFLVLLKAIESCQNWLLLASGILLGLAFVMKQPGFLFPLFGGLYLLRTTTESSPDWRKVIRRCAVFSAGVVLPFALTCLLLWRAGVFRAFWFWTFSYASQYVSEVGFAQGMQQLWRALPHIIGPLWGIWAIAGVGLTALFWDAAARSRGVFLAGFFLFSFLAVCPGFNFREHYFILLLPALSLLAATAVVSVTRTLKENRREVLALVPLILFASAFVYSLATQWYFLFVMDPVTASRVIYQPNPFPEAIQIGDYIRSHSPRDARIAVLGSEPEIYFYAHRHSATGYIYTYNLMEHQEYASQMQRQMIAEIEAARPELVVFVDVPYSWGVRPGSDTGILSWAQKYLQTQYEPVQTVHVLQLAPSPEVGPTEPSPFKVLIFRRKAS
jgi:Dolichyl-phosphate-mannose-protein mannosyltransferase